MKLYIKLTTLFVVLLVFALPLAAGESTGTKALDLCDRVNTVSEDHCGSCAGEKAEVKAEEKECSKEYKHKAKSGRENECNGEKVRQHKGEHESQNCKGETLRKQEHKCEGEYEHKKAKSKEKACKGEC